MTVSCLTDDGLIDESDLREVMKACMVENGMQFDEKEVASLANALFEDAVQVAAAFFIFFRNFVHCKHQDGCAGITVDDLKDQLTRHEGLLENLTISIGKWLVPPRPTAVRKSWCQSIRCDANYN